MRGVIALVQERLLSILANVFGGLALLLAAIGFHGILSFTVVRRTREIGIRMAIGARRTSVVRLVLRQILALGRAGLALGIPLVFAGQALHRERTVRTSGIRSGCGAAVALLVAVALGAGANRNLSRPIPGLGAEKRRRRKLHETDDRRRHGYLDRDYLTLARL